MAYEGLIGNKNAEKWTLEEAKKLFLEAIELTNEEETYYLKHGEKIAVEVKGYKYDFIGEVAKALGYYKSVFSWLIERHPDLLHLHTQLVESLESNCYCNGKKGYIKEASSIMNLKSNHKWTDRQTFDGSLDLRKGTADLFPDELDDEQTN